MAEHCSLRQSRLELRLEEEAAANALAEANALADSLDLVRKRTAAGQLTSRADWEELVPAHLMPDEFEERLMGLLEPESSMAFEAAPAEPAKASAFANRGVGVPKVFGAAAGTAPVAMPETKRAIPRPEPADDGFELRVPEGFELREVDGELALVQVAEAPAPQAREADASGIKQMQGASRTYLYDGTSMKPAFARWAYLAAEDDPLATFAYCVREDSRIYPRPMAEESLTNHPFSMTLAEITALWERAHALPQYADLGRVEATNGDVYYFSSEYLTREHAQSLAQWESVERHMNV